ncbi:MAG: hypothetical protein IRY94_15825 [Rhodospirillaceae bacterium]|nr:hypothetical protein [Rhodospirillaceae bacterium]
MFSALFPRSREIKELDHALRAAGLHPALVPEAVKITTVKLLREAGGAAAAARARAAALLAYCRLGAEAFAEANGAHAVAAVEARIAAAVEAGDSLDARLVLLTLHARIIEPGVVARFGLEAG